MHNVGHYVHESISWSISHFSAVESVLTDWVRQVYGVSPNLISELDYANLFAYTAIAASLVSMSFSWVGLVTGMNERQRANYRIELNVLKYISNTGGPLFFVSLLLLYASSVNKVLANALVNLSFSLLVFILVYILWIFVRFFLGIKLRRWLQSTKVPQTGL